MTIDSLAELLHGVSAVLVTPFFDRHAGVDESMATRIAARCDAAGIHVLVALGNTGEVHQLDAEERIAMLRATAAGRSRSALVGGLAGPAKARLRLAEAALELGYDAVMLHDPVDPFASDAGIRDLFLGFAENSPLPVILYPRSDRLSVESLAELASHPRVVAIKYALPELGAATAVLSMDSASEACVWICGLAESMFPAFLSLGVRGFTSGIANVRPDLALGVWEAAEQRDWEAFWSRLHLLLPFERLRQEDGNRYNVSTLKAALRHEGFAVGEVRPPHAPLSAEAEAELSAILNRWANVDHVPAAVP
jgi:4-hydroxy-tetrahydrodipicolinate synthase